MADEDQEVDAEGGGGGKKKLILLIVVGLLLIVLSVGGTIAVLTMFEDEPPPEMAEGGDEGASMEEPSEEKLPALYYPLKPSIVVTFNARGRQRYGQFDITLLTRNDLAIKEIELHMSRIRNDLVMLFSSMDYQEIQTAEGKELLRQQALKSIQKILEEEMGEPAIEQVLFTNLVMQ
ncbi:flagellar basal body-associated FliL family protein [Marinibactrum halimedae]|uniref:Flagellar protein FliL n=1 Tax=Marinibactrum halimedae TaxID=1444977 RepID=A0AA37WL17_9GAMM|nr:flagellar basal body-associated FliL family protein [Marinibactrum halimedae]MCD9459138.1 flagellar basal body-associated FliL family protein [Marinibactrum halimedae]GLS24740.1 flagellar basal body-associated protein FliL [Marinibactrum halimedae]